MCVRRPIMLVLSRKVNQKIVFPNLGITVQVLKSNGKVVRLGIDAPSQVRVFREELADDAEALNSSVLSELPTVPSELRHAIRNHLNTASLGLHLLHRKIESGELDQADSAIFRVFRELQAIDEAIGAHAKGEAQRAESTTAKRVLLVDDNRNESQLLAEYLRTFGYEVVTAYDGFEALSYLEGNKKPDFVLLDMQMPRMDGAETIRRIRSMPALDGIRIFVVSGFDAEKSPVEIGPQGADAWLTKPLVPSELMSLMENEQVRSQ
ncbi:MAG: response regulator [Planctomycetota bacterium]|nr:MAG: response regulator [Planctomycetota bacterium]